MARRGSISTTMPSEVNVCPPMLCRAPAIETDTCCSFASRRSRRSMSIAAASSPGNLSIARTLVLFSRLMSSTVVGPQAGVSLPKARSRNAVRTTCTAGLEMATTTRTAIKPAAKRHTILRRPEFFIFSIYPDQSGAAKYKSSSPPTPITARGPDFGRGSQFSGRCLMIRNCKYLIGTRLTGLRIAIGTRRGAARAVKQVSAPVAVKVSLMASLLSRSGATTLKGILISICTTALAVSAAAAYYGRRGWVLPDQEEGFYRAFVDLMVSFATYDQPNGAIALLCASTLAAVSSGALVGRFAARVAGSPTDRAGR